METATIFQLSGLLTIPLWILMIFLPKWNVTQRMMQSPWVIAPAAVLYTLLVLPMAMTVLPAVVKPELDVIQGFLSEPMGATVAWVHFLAFDLFVGRWIYLESRKRGISPWLAGPVLFFVLMLGPFGALLYLLMRVPHPQVVRTDAAGV